MGLYDELRPITNTLNEISGVDEIKRLFSKYPLVFGIINHKMAILKCSRAIYLKAGTSMGAVLMTFSSFKREAIVGQERPPVSERD